MSLSKQVAAYMQQEAWWSDEAHYLLAVSGGVDSSVMAWLFAELGLPMALAHCNFQLRGAEADKDERFVQQLAERFGCSFYSTTFDTESYAEENGSSIQMAARELRYEWLEDTRRSGGFTYVATAHHLNDSIETLIYNLVQGCGIRGLHGIPARQGNVIRPLLCVGRSQIEAYAKQQAVAYREDRTNAEVKYRRNFIRHELIPKLQHLNPGVEQTMADNLQRFRETEYLFKQMVRKAAQEIVIAQSPQFRLSIPALKAYSPALATLLYELLSPFGFNTAQVQDVASALQSPNSGKQFFSPDYHLLIDREEIIVAEQKPANKAQLKVTSSTSVLNLPGARLLLEKREGQPEPFSADENTALLNADLLQFPLTLRRWRAGDRFQPLGMEGKHQKLKDFFNNNKVSRLDKANTWVLEDSSGRIAWVVGYRISHAFRLLPDSSAYWVLKYELQ